jgi:hypothetical protein
MHGKKPTREQRKFIQSFGLNVENWLVVKNTPTEMVLMHRHNDKTTKTLPKGVSI